MNTVVKDGTSVKESQGILANIGGTTLSVLVEGAFLFKGVNMLKLELPEVETQRMIIRSIRLSDAQDLYEIASDPRVNKYLLYPMHKSLDETKEIIRKVFLTRVEQGVPSAYVLVDKKKNKMIGTCDFVSIHYHDVAEIGYSLNYDYWNNGLMSEAIKKVIEIGFDHVGIRIIQIKHSINNHASQRVIEKAGFQYEGTQRKLLYDKTINDYADCKIYSLLKEEWRERNERFSDQI